MTNNEMYERILRNVKENIAIFNIKEELSKNNKGNKNVIYSMMSACAVILIVGIVVINSPFGRATTNDSQNQNSIIEDSLETDIVQNIININQIDKPIEKIYHEVALMWDDFIVKSADELETYYQTKIIPNYIPEELKINEEKQFGIYNKNGQIYYDQNSIVYENNEANQILDITVAKQRKIHYDFDFRNDIEKTYETSVINGNEITIFYYNYEDYIDTPSNIIQYICYYTNFEKEGTCFDITSYNIELEEFTKILSSLL